MNLDVVFSLNRWIDNNKQELSSSKQHLSSSKNQIAIK